MTDLIIDNVNVAHQGSSHAAPGPPAVSGINPPTTPAGPPFTPAPFLYIAKSSRLIGRTATQSTKYKGKKICKVGTCMDIEAPANQPGKPLQYVPPNGADLVSKVAVGIAKITAPGNSGGVLIGKSKVATVMADVFLNIPTDKQTIHQSQSKLLDAGGLEAAWEGRAANPCVVVASGDPVALASGEVFDDAVDFTTYGVFPLEWKRSYASGRSQSLGPLGHGGWVHSFDQWLDVHDDHAVLHDEDGRTLVFPLVEEGAAVLLRGRGLALHRGRTSFSLERLSDHSVRHFEPLEPGGAPRLRSVADAFGNRLRLEYEAARLARVFDTAGREVRLSYDRDGRLMRVEVWARQALQQHVVYGYGDGGELASVENALGETESYTYDAHHRLVEKRLRSGLRFRFTYDPEHGRCVHSRGPGKLLNTEIDYPSPTRAIVTGNPEPKEFSFDDRGNLLEGKLVGVDAATTFTYDDDDLMLTAESSGGDVRAWEFDDHGRLVRQIGPGAQEAAFEYADGRLTRIVDGERVTTYTWDHRGAMTAVTYPDGVTIQLEVDRWGRTTRTFGPEGLLDTFVYDDEHNLVSFTDARGATTLLEYDAVGRLVAETDALGRTVRTTFDAIGRPIRQTMIDGTLVELTYDGGDNVVRSTDGQGLVLEARRCGTGRVATRVLPDGQAWSMTYDRLERLREIENPKGEVYEYQYDRAGRLAEERTFDGQVIRYGYSTRDLLRRMDYDDGTWEELDYDDRGLLVGRRSPHGDMKFERDAQGRAVAAIVDEHGGPVAVERVYSELGQLVSETVQGNQITFTYDAMGRVASRTLPGDLVTRYFYDLRGAMVGVEHAGEKILLQRDKIGREQRRHFYGSGLDVHFTFEADDRLAGLAASVVRPNAPQPSALVHRVWSYGAHARLASSLDTRGGSATYAHDEAGRLLAIRRATGGEELTYDVNGSLVGCDSPRPWSIAMGNVLRRTERARFEYDARRRRKAKEVLVGDDVGARTEYDWDLRERLREVRLPDGRRVLFKYDAYGRRVRKAIVTPHTDPTQPPHVRTVDYVWDHHELVMERDSEKGVRVFVTLRGTFIILMQVENDEPFACLHDHRGSVTDLIDGTGEVAWSAQRSAFGRVLAEQGGERARCPFGLLGHYVDEEVGLAATQHRYFDMENARWLSRDPLGFAGGPDLYGFDGSPTERVDPLGLMTRSDFKNFLEKYAQKRLDAQAASMASQSELGKRGRWVSAAGDSAERTGRSGRPRGDERPHRDDKNIHAEEEVIIGGSSGEAIGAGRPHCANCTHDIIDSGNVPSTSIRPDWEPRDDQVNVDNGATWDD